MITIADSRSNRVPVNRATSAARGVIPVLLIGWSATETSQQHEPSGASEKDSVETHRDQKASEGNGQLVIPGQGAALLLFYQMNPYKDSAIATYEVELDSLKELFRLSSQP